MGCVMEGILAKIYTERSCANNQTVFEEHDMMTDSVFV